VGVLLQPRRIAIWLRATSRALNSHISKPAEFGQFADVAAKLGMYWLLIYKAPS